MSRVSVTQLQNGTTADATQVNSDLNSIANVINGGLDLTNITAASLDNSIFLPAYDPVTRTKETTSNFVVSGLTIATSASLSSTIAAGTAYVNGKRISFSSTPITVVASKDTYIDLKDDGTIVQVSVNNGITTGMTLTTNSDGTNALRIAKVVSSGTAITSVTQTGVDNLFNFINPKSAAALALSGLVQSYTNSGTAGGPMYCLNLGGIKLLWGQTAAVSVPAGGSSNYGVTFPTSFFTTIQSATITSNAQTNDNRMMAVWAAVNASSGSINMSSWSNVAGTSTNGYFVIGT